VLGTLSFPFWFPETWVQAKEEEDDDGDIDMLAETGGGGGAAGTSGLLASSLWPGGRL